MENDGRNDAQDIFTTSDDSQWQYWNFWWSLKQFCKSNLSYSLTSSDAFTYNDGLNVAFDERRWRRRCWPHVVNRWIDTRSLDPDLVAIVINWTSFEQVFPNLNIYLEGCFYLFKIRLKKKKKRCLVWQETHEEQVEGLNPGPAYLIDHY